MYGQNNSTKKYEKLATVNKSKRSYTVKKIDGTNLSKNKVYKFYVVAYNKNKKIVKSNEIKFITNNTFGKYANANSIKVNKKELTLEVGKTEKLKVTTKIYKNKKHLPKKYGAATRYVSDNSKVAKVSSKGVITAVAAGSATIYIQDLGGKYCTTKVTVKNPEPAPEPTYTVTFDMMGHGTQIAAITGLKQGSLVTKPAESSVKGYVFDGWYKESECKNKWDFVKDTVTKDITLYAKWIEITMKAVLNNSDGSLNFYYDVKDYSADNITVYEGNTGDNYFFDDSKEGREKWGYNSKRSDVKSVVIDSSVAGYDGFTYTAYMFSDMDNAGSISGAEYLNTENVTNMANMFYGFGAASGSGLNSVPNVTDWKVEKVTDVSFMFFEYGSYCGTLSCVPNVSKWVTSSVTTFNAMFCGYAYGESGFEKLINEAPDVSGFDISKATDMTSMFENYAAYTCRIFELDLSGWNIADKSCLGLLSGNTTAIRWKVIIPKETKGNGWSEENTTSRWYYTSSKAYVSVRNKSFTRAD